MLTDIYEYKGKYYSETDLSEKYWNKDESVNMWGGDLWDLYFALRNDNICDDQTRYYATAHEDEDDYDNPEDLIRNEFRDLIVKNEEVEEDDA